MSTTALVTEHGFAIVLAVLLVALLIALLRVVALPLAALAVLLDGAADRATKSTLITNLIPEPEGATR
ncbi:hypothetical protein [Nocardiopsis nanhaiensis]